ncbi:unnamed protein product, partial [Rotaria sp. Silwood2]
MIHVQYFTERKTVIWSKYPHDTKWVIDSSFYSNDFTKLIVTWIFYPTQLRFDIN